MGGPYLGYYNTRIHGFGHVLVCMPDKLTKMAMIRDAILKYELRMHFPCCNNKKTLKKAYK